MRRGSRPGWPASWGRAGFHIAVWLMSMMVLIAQLPAIADEGGAVEPAFSESNGCGFPRAIPPLASTKGALSSSEPIRGPFGAFFGRTIGQVRASLIRWAVPMSDGEVLSVHHRMLPALRMVETNLAAAQAAGLQYPIRNTATFGFTARTISSRYAVSYHAVGIAIDINSTTNPQRFDGTLITDMPPWFVSAWTSAGFCWGGAWLDQKDPMHFSWMGPVTTPGYGPLPSPYPSLAAPARFTEMAASLPTVYGPLAPDGSYHLEDGNGDGAVDGIRVRPHPTGAVLEVAGSWGDFTMCGMSRWHLPGAPSGLPVILGGVGATGRPDVVFLDFSGPQLSTITYSARTGYQTGDTQTTGITSDSAATHLLADHDRDGRADMWVLRSGASTSLEIWTGASGFTTRVMEVPVPGDASRFMTGDRDLDGLPDLYAIDQTGRRLSVLSASGGFTTVAETIEIPMTMASGDVVVVSDYDGDGHGDLVRLDTAGTLTVLLGNQHVFGAANSWFRSPELHCRAELPLYIYQGRFADDDFSGFQPDIEWLATTGITRSCNPPFEDWFCPRRAVTRGEMAAFLNRALSLPAAVNDVFSDDGQSAFHEDINRLAAAGITRGCSLDGRSFCPDAFVSRQEMASFLSRAFQLAPSSAAVFTDVVGQFSADINALAAAGITRGCGPGLFCPLDAVTREQMAGFIHRAAGSTWPLVDG